MGFDTICPSSTTDSSHNSPSPAIRFCSLCAKPFTNELSRDRHTRYCRSRTCKRPRSCRACNAAKTKCSFEAPCARCTKKGIGCVYQEPIIDKGRSAGEYSPPSHGIRTEIRSTPNSLPEGGLRVNDGTLSVGSHAFSHLSAETATALLGDNPVPLVDLSPDMSTFNDSLAIDEFLSLDDNSWAQPECFVDVPMVPYDKTKKQAASWCQWTNRGLSFAVATETDSTLQAVDQRGRPRADHSANLVIQSLRAFPTMMIRRETMPWFIHPRSDLLSNSKKAALPEALSTCMGIAQMFASKTPETKPFLWRTIKVEYSRLLEEMRQMSKFEVLAATQVCMIYLIMCIVDYSPEDEVNGQELLVALYDLCCYFQKVCGGPKSESELSNPSTNWKDWIFAESRRRLSLLWFLVGCAACNKTGTACDPSGSYRSIPLPSPKSLWEASSQSAWESECEASRTLQLSGLVTMGDLIDVQTARHTPSNARKLDLWNAGVDNLSSLLNLVPTMV